MGIHKTPWNVMISVLFRICHSWSSVEEDFTITMIMKPKGNDYCCHCSLQIDSDSPCCSFMLLIIVGFIMVRCYDGIVRIGSRCSSSSSSSSSPSSSSSSSSWFAVTMALLGYYDVTMLRWHCYREPLFDREEHMVTRIIVQPSTASYATPELDV